MPQNSQKSSFTVSSNELAVQVGMLGDEIYEMHLLPPRSSDNIPERYQNIAGQLQAYLSGQSFNFDLPLYLKRLTPFQRKVYDELVKIPAGAVITYGELAERIGGRKYARAVGQAMRTNPFPLVIPCHRVIGQSGPGGYLSGLDHKHFLLRLEGYPDTKRLFG